MKIWKYFLGMLVLTAVAVWLAVFSFSDNNLHLIVCNVGQGDAILATYGNIQILTDGGPNNKVLDCLGKYMPFWDREIELVVSTHPDKDHYGGLIDVVRRYKIDTWLEGEGESSSQDYLVLKKEVGGRGIKILEAKDTPGLGLGLIHLDVLNQFENTPKITKNENSIVILLRYGKFKAILTGDAESEDLINDVKNNQIEFVNYLKVSHHGSKTGTNADLLDLIKPEMAVISVGKNSYGHPNKEVLDLLRERKIRTLRTDEMGDVQLKVNSQGQMVLTEKE